MIPNIHPTVDFAFKWLFGREQTRPLLRSLLQAVLQPPPRGQIVELQLLNPFSSKDALDDKLSIVDVKARDQSGQQFHVEMQLLPERAFRPRVLYYWADLYRQQLLEGEPYQGLRPTYSICFTDFALFPDVPNYFLKFELRERTHALVFSPHLVVYTVELSKFRRTAEELSGPLDMWLYFLRHAATLDSAALPVSLQTTDVERAMEELIMLSQNDLERERYLARIKVQRDELSRLHSAREEGLEQGREQGLQQGREQGLQQGREQGLERGQYIGAIRSYQELLQQPVTPVDQLVSLSLEELSKLVERLKQDLAK